MKKKDSISIGFTGDVSFDEYASTLYNHKEKIDKDILNFLSLNDYNIVNLESPVTLEIKSNKTSLIHKTTKEQLKYMKKIIPNPIVTLANNHIMDYGINGLNDTIKNLNENEIKYFGAGNNLEEASKYIILGDDVKVGIIAVQYKNYLVATNENPGTFHESNLKLLKLKIKEMKKNVDWVVVVYHGGEEFVSVPMPYTRKLLKKIMNFGCDIIVAHHSHVIQHYELYDKKAIFYSLGNFIFDTDLQRAMGDTDTGLLLNIEFTKENFKIDKKIIKNNRELNILETVNNDNKFKRLPYRNYNKIWKKEILKVRKISNVRKDVIRKNINRYINNDLNNKMVSFNYFEKQLKDVKIKLSVKKKNKFKNNKLIIFIKNCFSNPKYRYYFKAKISSIFRK